MPRKECAAELFEGCLQATYRKAARGGGHYALSRRGGEIKVYFQHSVGREDWRHNLDFIAVRHMLGRERICCHRGFLQVWQGMEEELEVQIERERARGAWRIMCVGYSHGAALALLAVLHFCIRFPQKRICGIGFGTPRVLWGHIPRAVKEAAAAFLAVRNPPDFVTHLPPILSGYHTPHPLLTLWWI